VDWEWLRSEVPDVGGYAPWYGQGPIPFMQVNNDRALATGLTFRPIGDTANDMIARLSERQPPKEWRAGLNPVKEAEVLSKWHSR
jgi:hypothetical protein